MRSLLLLLFLSIALPLQAAEPAGKVVSLTGKVKVFRGGAVRGEAVENPGLPLYIGDVVRTGAGAQALLRLGEGDRVVLEGNSTLTLRARSKSHVDTGTVLFDIRKRSGVQGVAVTAATVTMGVKGTRFAVLAEGEKVSVYLKEGNLEVTAGKGPIQHHADSLLAGAEEAQRQLADDFEQTQEKMRAEFDAAREQMRQGNIEYVDQVLMHSGSFLLLEGNEAWDAKAPEWLDEKLAVFDSKDDFFK